MCPKVVWCAQAILAAAVCGARMHVLYLQTPATRLLILGARGAGKSLHSRQLARKLGLFHIQFRERLQEMIMAKTKKKIGPEFEDEDKGDDDIIDE